MGADWSLPVTTSLYSNLIDYIKNRDSDCATMFQDGAATNIPDNSVRYNRSTKKFQEWDETGSTWGDLEVGNISAGSVGNSQLADDAVTGSELLLNNDQWLRGKVAAGSAHNMMSINASDELLINAYTGKSVYFQRGGSSFMSFSPAGITPVGAMDIGSASNQFDEVFAQKSFYSGGIKQVGTITNHDLELFRNNASRWRIASGNQLEPTAAGTNLGTATNYIGTAYINSLTAQATNLNLDAASSIRFYKPILPDETDTRDLGSSAKRIREIYVQSLRYCQNVTMRDGQMYLGTDTSHNVNLMFGGITQFQILLDQFNPIGNLSKKIGNSSAHMAQIWTNSIDSAAHIYVTAGSGYNVTLSGRLVLADQFTATSRTEINEYLRVTVDGLTRYLRLYS